MKENKEFQTFMKSSQAPGGEIDSRLESLVARDLKHFPLRVFAKALGLHWFAGALTLLICPQFGWNPFQVSPHLPHIFMEYGMWACGLFCGSLFMLFGGLGTRLFASGNEAVLLKQRGHRFAFALSGLTLGLLMLFGGLHGGAEVYFSFQFITFWIVGALAFDLLCFKLGRTRFQSV